MNAKLAAKNGNILLSIDDCAAHPKNAAQLSEEFLPPNMKLQSYSHWIRMQLRF
jgi:hypothetical protein